MNRQSPITTLKGIGPRRAELLGKLGLFSVGDLLTFAPRDYRDYSRLSSVSALENGQEAVVRVRLTAEPKLARIRRTLNILSVRAEDESGRLLLTWYNQPYRKAALQVGDTVYAAGRADRRSGLRLINPAISADLPGILPVYHCTAGLKQQQLRDAVKQALAASGPQAETLPEQLLSDYSLCGAERAGQWVHFPPNLQALEAARRRLAFEDMLMYLLVAEELRQKRREKRATAFSTGLQKEFLQGFPFAPTRAQLKVMGEIEADMAQNVPMNRLVQGDVGSGKTLPALYAMYIAVKGGSQAALMAPTELLAAQHFSIVQALFGRRALLLTGSMKAAERERARDMIASGEALAVVGTHALISEGVEFCRPGLMITDEQHRFGVSQRAALGVECAHVLIMSATPIPRTLALVLYGDLDVSVLDELPPGRKPIKTNFVPSERREDMYAFVARQAEQGLQTYVVCPLVAHSDAMEDAAAAEEVYAELKRSLPCRVGLLHGQQAKQVQSAAAEAFRRGELDVLVCTTVIEVGVDVPNAAVMVVEDAERFGLAQLHQLRGRVGRGSAESFCFLLSDSGAESVQQRLRTLCTTQDGFAIAKEDMKMRGPGEFLGLRQHGAGDFAAMALAADMRLLEQAKQAAQRLFCEPGLQPYAAGLKERARLRLDNINHIAPN